MITGDSIRLCRFTDRSGRRNYEVLNWGDSLLSSLSFDAAGGGSENERDEKFDP